MQDVALANALFQHAADLGSSEGMALLAGSYLTGNGVARNLGRARELFAEAQETGSPTV